MALQQSIDIGPLTDTYATEVIPRGTPRYEAVTGLNYRFVRFVDQDAAIGETVYLASATGAWDVTTDYTGGSGVATKVVGIALGTVDISAAAYGWIQVPPGMSAMVRTDAGVAAGDPLIGHTVDGEADTMIAGEEHLVFGFAVAADTTINGQDACIAFLV